MTYIQLNKSKSASQVVDEIWEKNDWEKVTGATLHGWSYWSAWQRCPREAHLNAQSTSRDESNPLAIGTFFHAFLVSFYKGVPMSAEALREAMLERAIDQGPNIDEAWRVFASYQVYYGQDYLKPLGTEVYAEITRNGVKLSCRYDLIARIDAPPIGLGLEPGVYVVNHKTAGRFTADMLDGWDLNGQILGEIACWGPKLEAQYGKLQGNVINIAGKQKIPKFHRAFVPASSFRIDQHVENLLDTQQQRDHYQMFNKYPQRFAACVRQYGKCDHYEICRVGE